MESHDRNRHHLVPRSILECAFGSQGTQKEAREVTEENVIYRWDKRLHEIYHALFSGRTVMSTYESLPYLWKSFKASSIRKRRNEYTKTELWNELFGNDVEVEEARDQLRYFIYFYLFAKNTSHKINEVFEPKELLDRELFRIYRDILPKSFFKQHAWDILFGRAAPLDRAKELLQDVYKSCKPFTL